MSACDGTHAAAANSAASATKASAARSPADERRHPEIMTTEQVVKITTAGQRSGEAFQNISASAARITPDRSTATTALAFAFILASLLTVQHIRMWMRLMTGCSPSFAVTS